MSLDGGGRRWTFTLKKNQAARHVPTSTMVVFCCNACGESVKKNKVQQHYEQKCRSCHVLSCMDCGKDFVGEEYQSHTRFVGGLLRRRRGNPAHAAPPQLCERG